MRLKVALEIALDCDLTTVGEAVYNIRIHSISLFNYSDILYELNELYDELTYCETLNITENTKIKPVLEILNTQNYETNYQVVKETANRNKNIIADFPCRVKVKDHKPYDFLWVSFEQTWNNTSGGLETIGCDAITKQITDVFLPKDLPNEDCLVYFNGVFGYSVPESTKFIEDVKNHCVKGCSTYKEYM